MTSCIQIDVPCSQKQILTLLKFSINDKHYYLPYGYYLVSELKILGHVPTSHILAEIKPGKVDELDDDCAVLINGCENFQSFPGVGENS